MLKWAVTARGSPISTSGSGQAGTTPGGATENYVSAASRAGAWPTFDDVSVAQSCQVRWSAHWSMDDDSDDDKDSLSAYDDNTSTLEQMMTIDFNDDSQSSGESSTDRVHDRRQWLCRQIERERRLRTGAETLLQATYSDKLRDAIIVELSTINRNLQTMKEELADLSLNKPAVTSKSEWLVDCTGCSPMVALHLKETRNIDFKPALVGYVSSHYYEDGEKYGAQFDRLTEMRQLCCNASWTDEHVDNLFTYYNQLYFVDRRFFPSRHDGRISFDWYDSFTGARSSQKSIAFEKGSILYNIGALYAQKGARRNRRTVSGLEASATDFRLSAGVFRFLRDNFQHAPSVDMQSSVISCLVHLMLTQARESVIDRTLLEYDNTSRADSVQPEDLLRHVELAQECSTLAASNGELTTMLSTMPLRGFLPVSWEELCRCKRGYYSSLAHYVVALALLDVSQVTNTHHRSRLIHVLMNAHSRAVGEHTPRRPVYTDAAVETAHGRLLLAKAHIRQSILSSEEAMKIVIERQELDELRTQLQRIRDRSLRRFSELELEDDFTELQLAPEVCARSKLHVDPIAPDFVQYKVADLFHQLGCLSIFSARHDWTPPRPVNLTRRQSDQEFGFTVRGEAPVIVATVDDSSPAQVAGVHVGDFIVGVGDVDVRWSRHEKVVAMIRDSGLAIRLSLVTPIDRNFVDPDTAASGDRDPQSFSVSSLPAQSDMVADTVTALRGTFPISRDAVHERTAEMDTPTLARHWGFRRRRKREKTSQ